MKQLALHQPWGSMMFAPGGLRKVNETRSWKTDYRGPVVIHAAQHWDEESAGICHREAFASGLKAMRYERASDLPRGAALGVVDLVSILPTDQIRDQLSPRELALGDYSDGRWAWITAEPRLFPRPIPWSGQRGLKDWPVNKLHTFGYTGRDPDDLQALVSDLDAWVVDIRYRPRSRQEKWEQQAVEARFGKRYKWVQTLGNINYNRPDLGISLVDQEEGCFRLMLMLMQKPCIILCACRQLESCHRLTVATLMQDQYAVEVEYV